VEAQRELPHGRGDLAADRHDHRGGGQRDFDLSVALGARCERQGRGHDQSADEERHAPQREDCRHVTREVAAVGRGPAIEVHQ
jgi:hypothetical protein